MEAIHCILVFFTSVSTSTMSRLAQGTIKERNGTVNLLVSEESKIEILQVLNSSVSILCLFLPNKLFMQSRFQAGNSE